MEARAVARNVRISPQKARLDADLIRGRDVEQALATLRMSRRKGSRLLLNVLESAIANATNNFDMNEDALYVAKVTVDQGPVLKRWRPRARGRADMIRKPMAHLTVVLRERDAAANQAAASAKDA